MKIIAVLLTLAFLTGIYALTEHRFFQVHKEELQKIAKKCGRQMNASTVDMETLLNYGIPKTHEGHCVLYCVNRALNIQKEDGSLDIKGIISLLEILKLLDPEFYDIALRFFHLCSTEAKIESDPCLTAANIAICGRKRANMINFKK